MTKLYSELANVYHEMYQSIFDYENEFNVYKGKLISRGCKTILEIGCGSGNLSAKFVDAGFEYKGMDVSEDMLDIAKNSNPTAEFVIGDMRNFELQKKFEAILITGRSFCYMKENGDVRATLKQIYSHLKDDGYLIFDNFNAEEIFLNFSNEFTQESQFNQKKYKRVSRSSINLDTGWTWNILATYSVEINGKESEIGTDESTLRAFTKDELCLFLSMEGFFVEEIIKDGFGIDIVAKKGGK